MNLVNQQTENKKPAIDVQAEVSTLIDQCAAALNEVGVPQERIAIMLNDSMVAHAKTGGLENQRYALNLFWQAQLGQFGGAAFRARGSLLPVGREGDWMAYFKSKVIPFIVDNSLPFPWVNKTDEVQ